MSLGRSLRVLQRRLAIRGAVALQLDALGRWRERRRCRNGGACDARVLYFHGTPPDRADGLRRQLTWLQRHFRIIDFTEFTEARTPPAADPKPPLLLTFDDGLVSNYEVAAPVLESMGLRGLFFVVPGFALISGENARQFCRDHILQTRVETAMSPEQIAALAERGHAIGNHTFSHANLRKVPPSAYQHEIVDSAAVIESWIGRPVTAFAWPFRWNAITAAAFDLAADRHHFCFAPCAGRTRLPSARRSVIWRTAMETHFTAAEMRFQCSGLADLPASPRRRRLSATLQPQLAMGTAA